jgi:hypothetical protein
MTEIEQLQKIIKDLHGCDSRHLGSIRVIETFQGRDPWEGIVEVFFLIHYPQAKEAYAWSYKGDNGEVEYVAILGIPPVESPSDAVRTHIAAEGQKQIK